MNKLMILFVAAVATSPVWAIQGTIYTATDSKKGDIKWQSRAKSYSISFKKGNTVVSAEYPLADVERLDIDKPRRSAYFSHSASVNGLSHILSVRRP